MSDSLNERRWPTHGARYGYAMVKAHYRFDPLLFDPLERSQMYFCCAWEAYKVDLTPFFNAFARDRAQMLADFANGMVA